MAIQHVPMIDVLGNEFVALWDVRDDERVYMAVIETEDGRRIVRNAEGKFHFADSGVEVRIVNEPPTVPRGNVKK